MALSDRDLEKQLGLPSQSFSSNRPPSPPPPYSLQPNSLEAAPSAPLAPTGVHVIVRDLRRNAPRSSADQNLRREIREEVLEEVRRDRSRRKWCEFLITMAVLLVTFVIIAIMSRHRS